MWIKSNNTFVVDLPCSAPIPLFIIFFLIYFYSLFIYLFVYLLFIFLFSPQRQSLCNNGRVPTEYSCGAWVLGNVSGAQPLCALHCINVHLRTDAGPSGWTVVNDDVCSSSTGFTFLVGCSLCLGEWKKKSQFSLNTNLFIFPNKNIIKKR